MVSLDVVSNKYIEIGLMHGNSGCVKVCESLDLHKYLLEMRS